MLLEDNKLNKNLSVPLYHFLSDKPFTFKQTIIHVMSLVDEINKVYGNYVLWIMQMSLLKLRALQCRHKYLIIFSPCLFS